MAEVLVADSETDGLLDAVTRLHMLQMGTLDGEDVTIYLDPSVDPGVVQAARDLGMKCPVRPLSEGIERLRVAKLAYWHNGIGYDRHISDRFAPGIWSRERSRDTLVMCRLAWSSERQHSLEAWGHRMGILKGDFKGPWDRVTPEMLVYSEQDVVVGRALARKALAALEGQERAWETEEAVAYWIDRQQSNGFRLDVKRAEGLYVDLLARKADLVRQLAAAFPARWVKVGDVVPKTSSSKFHFAKGVPYSRVEYREFSASSRQMIAERLIEKGWKPTKKTPTGLPEVSEEVLSSLVWWLPEAALLTEYLDIEKQLGAIGGKGGWLSLVKSTGLVHGRVNSLGAYTQRAAHSKPNMTTVPKEGPYRGLWGPTRPGWKLVGVDAEGIQARVTAHYLVHWDQGAFANRCVNGDSDLGTDIHSANRDAIINCFPEPMRADRKATRAPTKNILYGILFGAQDARLGMTLKEGCLKAKVKPPRAPNRELGAAIRRGLEKSMTGLGKLTAGPFSKDPAEWGLVERTYEKRKWLAGLDGRILRPPARRLAFVTIVQGGEAVIMKTALVIFADEFMPADGLEFGQDWALCVWAHDEFQLEARPEISEHVGARMAEAIRVAGERLNMKCAQAGKATVGDTWAETH